MGVSITMVMLKAAHLPENFEKSHGYAQYDSAGRFVRHHGIVHGSRTNESQYSINYSYYYCCYLCHRIFNGRPTTTNHRQEVLT
jgi:hypothetical protein